MKRTTFKHILFLAAIMAILLACVSANAGSTTHIINWNNSAYSQISQDTFSSVSRPANNNATEHIVNLNFSFTGNADKYGAEIRIPAYIFADRDGNPIGSFEVPLPKYDPANPAMSEPPHAATKFNWRLDAATGEIVISNYESIVDTFFVKVSLKYMVSPYLVKTGYKKTFNATMNVNALTGPGTYTLESYTSNDINIEYITNANLSSVSKYSPAVYKSWQTNWGTPPTGINTADYFYIRWYIYGNASTNDTQPFSVGFKEIIPASDEYGAIFGVSTSTTSGFRRCTLDEFNNTINNPYSTVNRPYTYSSNGNTYWSTYVYYMYPKTLLDASGKATVRNQVDLILEGVDGARDQKTATSSYVYEENPVVTPPTVPANSAYTYKYNSGTSYGAINQLENNKLSQEPVTLTSSNSGTRGSFYFYGYTRGWRHTEQNYRFGQIPYTSELYDDRLVLGGTDLQDGDYQYSRLYFQGFTVYVPSAAATSYTEVAKPNADYAPLTLQIKKNGVWEDYASIQKQANGTYAYTPIGNTSSVPTGSYLDIPLPAGTTGVKYLYTDKVVYVNFSYSYLTAQLFPTDRVLGIIKDQDGIHARNYVYCKSYDNAGNLVTSGSHSVSHYLTRIKAVGRHSKSWSSAVNDIYTSRFYFPITLQAYTEIQHPETVLTEVLKGDYLIEQKISTFYDLLPPGTYADLSTIRVTGYGTTGNEKNNGLTSPLNRAPQYVDFPTRIEVHDNWKGSGRTMLIVRAQTPAGYTNLNHLKYGTYSTLQSGMRLTFNLYNTWLNAIDNGTTIYNYSAYETQNGSFYNAYPDNAASSTIPSSLKNAFTDLNRDGNPTGTLNSFLYASAAPYYAPLDAAELGFNKAVASPENPAFGDFVRVQAGGEYTYRLRLENAVASAKDLIYYDILENAHGTNAYWKGSLLNVDVSHARSRGINVKTYYSLVSIDDSAIFADPKHLDNNPTVWKSWDTEPPADPGLVKALAFDLRKTITGAEYIARPGQSVLVNISMRAPVDASSYIANDILAYNRAFCANNKSSLTGAWDPAPSVEACNPVTVGLKDMGLDFGKLSTPESGTALAPAVVYGQDKISYTINFTNKNLAQSIQDIIVEDTIPAGLSIDVAGIKVMMDDNPNTLHDIELSTRVDVLNITGNKIVMRVISLAGQEKISVIIPCTVQPMAQGKNTTFENTATITGIYGKSVTVNSNTTYHKQEYAQAVLPISKTLTGRDMAAGEFSFFLKDSQGAVLETIISPDALAGTAANLVFSTLYFDAAGTYTYSVEEKQGSLDSVVYDTSKYLVTITVTKDNTGKLNAAVAYQLNSASVSSVAFVNKYETTSFKATKVWDTRSQGIPFPGYQHPAIQLQLLRDGVAWGAAADIPASAWGDYSVDHEWTNLPKLKSDGTPSVYTVLETYVPYDYIAKTENKALPNGSFEGTVTNIYWPKARSVRKVWTGPVPVPVGNETLVKMTINQVILREVPAVQPGGEPYAASTVIETVVYPVQMEMNGLADSLPDPLPGNPYDLHGEFTPWIYTITLPTTGTYNNPGHPDHNKNVYYYYLIKEVTQPVHYLTGYTKVISGRGAEVENVYQLTSFTVNKEWINGPATKPTTYVQILQNDAVCSVVHNGVDYSQPIALPHGTTSYTWEGLPKYKVWNKTVAEDPSKREKHVYSAVEVTSAGIPVTGPSDSFPYEATSNADGSLITNTYKIPNTTVVATKTWVNGPEADHTALPLLLYRSLGTGAPELIVDSFTLDITQDVLNPNKFTYTWTELDKTDINGAQYTYTVVEFTDQDGNRYVGGNKYHMTQAGNDITNTYVVPTTDFHAYKSWIGGKAEDYSAVDLQLTRYVAGETPEVVTNAPQKFPQEAGANEYTYIWSNLEATDINGAPYTYIVSEKHAVDGKYVVNGRTYTVSQHENAIANTFTPDLTVRRAIKYWEGGDPADYAPVPFQATRTVAGAIEPEVEVVYAPYVLSSTDKGLTEYTYIWNDLPATDMYANRYIYSIEEFSAIEHRVLVGDNTYNVISKKDIPGQFGLITFTNAYVAPNSCKVSIPVHKIVSGDPYKLNEGDFSFLLKGPGVETEVSNNSLGYAVFPEITFSKEGAYTYTLNEVKGSIPNITYDNSQYTITVDVKHNPVSNCLEAKLSFLKNGTAFDGGIPVFINSHSLPEPVEPPATDPPKPKPPVDPPKPSYPTLHVPITGHKVFEHGSLKGGDFTFILKDKDGKVLAEATNQKDGSFTFPDRTFSLEVQNYTFTVHEAPGRDSGIVYDNAVYTIKVTTRAVGGHLEATVDVFKDGAPYTGTVTFTNCPAVPPTGDNTPAIVLTLAGLGALAFLAYLYLKRRKKH